MRAPTKFSEDVVPVSDLKVNPGKILHQVDETHRPVLLTSRGRGVAVVQSLAEYEADNEGRDFLRSVVQGLVDCSNGGRATLTLQVGAVARIVSSALHSTTSSRSGPFPCSWTVRLPSNLRVDASSAEAASNSARIRRSGGG